MKRFAAVLLVFCALFAVLCSEALAQQTPLYVELGLNKDVFYLGDYMFVYLNVGNMGFDVMVDAYLSLTTPDGTVLYAPDLTPLAHPLQTQVHIPGGGETGWFYHDYYRLPSLRLPLFEPGDYTFSLWLCGAGTSDQVTPKSTQSFRLVPCELDSWVNDNYVTDLYVDEEGIWAGLLNGIEFISFDNSYRRTWLREDGVCSSWTEVFRTLDGKPVAAGDSVGASVREPFGWHTAPTVPGTDAFTAGIIEAVTDSEGTWWVLHWSEDALMPSGRQLLRVWPDGYYEDIGSQLADTIMRLCLVWDGRACAVGQEGLYVHNGWSFDFCGFQILHFASLGDAHGDIRGNVWLSLNISYTYCLARYDLNVQDVTWYVYDTSELPLPVSDIASDAFGNVWFAGQGGIARFDGVGFISYPTDFRPTSIDFGPDNTIYCGTGYGAPDIDGIQVFKDGAWISYKNPEPEVRAANYDFVLGFADGGAILPGSSFDFSPRCEGYEVLDGRTWRSVFDDGSLPVHLVGVSQGKSGQWAWCNSGNVFRREGDAWLNTTEGSDLLRGETINGVLEDDDGNVFLGSQKGLYAFIEGAWESIETPEPAGGGSGYFGYTGIMIDHGGNIYLSDAHYRFQEWVNDCGVSMLDTNGNWSRIDVSNLLPARAHAVGLSDDDVLYVSGVHPDEGGYLVVIDGDDVRTYWLRDYGFHPEYITAIAFDLAGRAWIMTQERGCWGRMIIYDPENEAFSDIHESSGILAGNINSNRAVYNNMFDRSFCEYGTLWWAGSGGPKRLNLAPQSRIMINRDLYGVGDTVRVAVHFANYAGSIAVDWYAAIEDMQGNRYYWQPTFETGESSWANIEVPAIANIVVPTDTSFILPFGPIMIPLNFTDGHYRWRSGFKRAGGDEWLGVGFPSYDEFCVVRPPTP